MTKIAGSGSESISQRHGSADPDPPQNVMDPQHCFKRINMIWFFDAQWFKNETHTDLMNSNLTVLSSIISSPLMLNLALKFLGFYMNGTLIEVFVARIGILVSSNIIAVRYLISKEIR
jgi:hypothetical protein